MDIIIEGRCGDHDYIVADRDSGLIRRMGRGEPPSAPDLSFGEGCTLIPGDFNAHSHPEQSIYVEIVDKEWDLARWCRETIYKYSVDMTAEMIYHGCVRAFGRMLSYGVTSVMVSFYCHNKRDNELDLSVIRAARDVGIRLFFGRMNYDEISEGAYPEKRASQLSYYETPERAEENFIGLLGHEGPRVVVAPALHSFHANTLEAVIRGICLGARYGRKVQFHLSEDEGDVSLCLKRYGMRPIEVLADLKEKGAVPSLDCLVLSDCVWTDRRERELIREHGMSVVFNGRMNERVKAGKSEVKEYIELGIPVYVGTDGEASNDDLSVKNERDWLVKNHGLDENEASRLRRPFEMAGMRVGELTEGAAADICVMKNGRLHALFVGGVPVMEGGRLLSEKTIRAADSYIEELWQKRRG